MHPKFLYQVLALNNLLSVMSENKHVHLSKLATNKCKIFLTQGITGALLRHHTLWQKYIKFYENCFKYIKLKALPCCGTTDVMVGVLVFAIVSGAILVLLTNPATQYIL
jgi:hypothetical protein